MRGHLGFRSQAKLFQPVAYVFTSGAQSPFSIPPGAKIVKAWAVGEGGSCVSSVYATGAGAGDVAYKTWSAVPGSSLTYSFASGNATVSYSGQSFTAVKGFTDSDVRAGYSSGSYDGIAYGGGGTFGSGDGRIIARGGAIGASNASVSSPNKRTPAIDVSGLLSAVALAGYKTIEDDSLPYPAFGSGGYYAEPTYSLLGEDLDPGIGGGAAADGRDPGSAAIVLYFA